jgi:hypothetical protein
MVVNDSFWCCFARGGGGGRGGSTVVELEIETQFIAFRLVPHVTAAAAAAAAGFVGRDLGSMGENIFF